MSTNFTGVTFAKQKVTPSDDAIIRRAILPDGILYGCEITYSGSTLTMAAGQLLICGRQIRHPASQNWAVVDATSGYARLLLTVDLTKTATKETFEQVVDSIEYASSEDGFPELEQTDINVDGSRYQVVACIVSLGAGGITGIVSQLGISVVESSGGLNFSVVGGTAQPSDPAENAIWANTDVDIPSYILSPMEPAEPVQGMLWIRTGTPCDVPFSALKKSGIQICPVSAKQYVDGAWIGMDAYIYQAEWIQFSSAFDGVLYNEGDQCVEATGGWTVTGTARLDDTDIWVQSVGGGSFGGQIVTEKPIDVTDFKTLYVNAGSYYDNGFLVMLCETQNASNGQTATLKVKSTGLSSLDISSVEGEYYVIIAGHTQKGSGSVTKIYLE